MRAAFVLATLLSPAVCLDVKVGAAGGVSAGVASSLRLSQCLTLSTEVDGVACLHAGAGAGTGADAGAGAGAAASVVVFVDDARLALEGALLRGWFDFAATIIDASQGAAVDVSTALHQTSGRIRARLVELAERLASTAMASAIPPAIEWAQSPTHVFVNVKWALKLSNPATLGCVPSAPALGENGRIDFRAACNVKRKTFALSAQLWGNITPAECDWAESSVGRASLTLRKAEDGPWPRLLAAKTVRVPVWWSMHENYEKANDNWHSMTPTPLPTPTPTQKPMPTPQATPIPTLPPDAILLGGGENESESTTPSVVSLE